jgi:hypothetical protein
MKNKIIVLIAFIAVTSAPVAQTPLFTTVCITNNHVFASVKIERKGWETSSYILHVTADKRKPGKIMLPDDISNREIIALFPAKNNILIVMTQWTLEQGDNPQFHIYNWKTKKWERVGETDCTTFHKVFVRKDTVLFSCFGYSEAGKEVELEKKVFFKGITFTKAGEFTVPISSVADGALRAELLGEKFNWNELKISRNKKEWVFRPY